MFPDAVFPPTIFPPCIFPRPSVPSPEPVTPAVDIRFLYPRRKPLDDEDALLMFLLDL